MLRKNSFGRAIRPEEKKMDEKIRRIFVWCYFLSYLSHAWTLKHVCAVVKCYRSKDTYGTQTHVLDVDIANTRIRLRCVLFDGKAEKKKREEIYGAQFKSPDHRLSTSTSTSIEWASKTAHWLARMLLIISFSFASFASSNQCFFLGCLSAVAMRVTYALNTRHCDAVELVSYDRLTRKHTLVKILIRSTQIKGYC